MSAGTWDYLRALARRCGYPTPALAALLGSGCLFHESEARPLGSPPYFRKIDDHFTAHAAQAAARGQLHGLIAASGVTPSSDFAYGYQQAFIDVSQGASGMVPAVPPRRYWGDEYRSPEGQSLVQEWFAGYSAGGVRASECYANNALLTSGVYMSPNSAANAERGTP